MFDVIVIGGGPGGYHSAQLLGARGFSVAVIEKGDLGGVCLNQGCIPFKTYLHVTGIVHETRKYCAEGILSATSCNINQMPLLEKKSKVVKGLRQGVFAGLQSKSVTLIEGIARYSGRSVNGYLFDVDGKTFEGKKVILATGSREVELPNINRNGKVEIISSKEMLELSELPKSITIVGAGAIGLEAASFFNEAGSKVSVIEAASSVGGRIDREIASSLERILNKKGIEIFTNTRFKEIDEDKICAEKTDGTTEYIQSEYLLVAVGRKPNIDVEMLDSLNISYDKNGIAIDDRCATTDENIFACGDVTGKLMLAHTAYHQAKVISDIISGEKNVADYNTIPRVIYTNPEVLSVGMTEQECESAEIEYQARSLPMTYSGKYFADYGKDGARAKMIVDKDRCVIGFHMIGNGASEISLAVEMMIANRMKIDDVCNLVYAHPSYSEILGDLAEAFH